MRILSGIQPSGKLHLGNYFGMMKPALCLQEQGEAFLFIANYHALTTVADPAQLLANTFDVALDFLACGLDPQRTVFFRQSDVPEVTELTWLLSTITPMGLLERCHSYKDKLAKGIPASNGLFSYPVLMAADILLYQADLVPVGRDQKQHVEVTRDLAIKFNNQFDPVFKIPAPSILEDVAVVPGIDGQKMSKSYGNTIELFAIRRRPRRASCASSRIARRWKSLKTRTRATSSRFTSSSPRLPNAKTWPPATAPAISATAQPRRRSSRPLTPPLPRCASAARNWRRTATTSSRSCAAARNAPASRRAKP